MLVSFGFIIVTLIYTLGNKTVEGAEEIFTITNFLIASGIISICSRLDDLKRK